MSKVFVVFSSLFLSLTVFAGVSDVSPNTDLLEPSKVESVIELQKETAQLPAIRLVKVTNGGSTDVSSLMVPSRLYLGFHKNGEMFDVDGSYLLVPGLTKVVSATLDSKAKTIQLVTESLDEDLKTKVTASIRVFIADVLKEIATAQVSDEEPAYGLQSTIGVQNQNP